MYSEPTLQLAFMALLTEPDINLTMKSRRTPDFLLSTIGRDNISSIDSKGELTGRQEIKDY